MRRILVAVVLLMAACDPPEAESRFVYVAVGASDTTGVGLADPQGQAWPRLFHQRAVPDAEYVNVGVAGSTVADALQAQVPKALEARSTVVTVWLNVNDLSRFVGPAAYEAQLRDLVHRLREGGTNVLVANTPVIDRLPAVMRLGLSPDAVNAAVDSYNEAIRRVVESEHAVLVDLHAVPFDPGYVGPDGFHPSAAGHQAVAAAFAEAYERAFATVKS